MKHGGRNVMIQGFLAASGSGQLAAIESSDIVTCPSVLDENTGESVHKN